MPRDLIERRDIVKKATYNSRDPITTILSAIKELLKFTDITRTSYNQIHTCNIAYVIVHILVKFGLAIREWDIMPTIQKKWVWFKHFFQKAHWELWETSDLTIEDSVMHNANMVQDEVAGLQEVLYQEQFPTDNPKVIEEPFNHVSDAVQNTQQQLATQLQQMQEMM